MSMAMPPSSLLRPHHQRLSHYHQHGHLSSTSPPHCERPNVLSMLTTRKDRTRMNAHIYVRGPRNTLRGSEQHWETLEYARPSSARAAAAIPTYGKSTLVMIVVWHVKYKAASESIIGRSHQPTVFAMRARWKRRWAPPCVFRLECNDVTVAVESPHEKKI